MERNSTLLFLLKGLVPYTRENMLLSFKPGKFFAELEKTTGRSRAALRQSYFRAQRKGLITKDPVPRLTIKGRLKLTPFVAKELGPSARLMIIFDIPESASVLRYQLRYLLKNLKFQQIQKSVWVTPYDHSEIVAEAIQELGLTDCVQLYECAPIQLAKTYIQNL